jgi:solute carrier family 35 protein E1
MSSATCRKIKAFLMIAMLSVAEGRRVHSNIHLHDATQPRRSEDAPTASVAASADEFAEMAFSDLVNDPNFQDQMMLFADHAKMMMNDEELGAQSKSIAKEMQKMKSDSTLEQQSRVINMMTALMEDPRFQEQATYAANELDSLIKNDPKFEELSRDISEKLQANQMSKEEASEKVQEVFSDPNFLKDEARVSQAVESLMADSTLQQQAESLAELIEDTDGNDDPLRIAERVGELIANSDLRERAKLVTDEIAKTEPNMEEQLAAYMADPDLRDELEATVNEEPKALLQESASSAWAPSKALAAALAATSSRVRGGNKALRMNGATLPVQGEDDMANQGQETPTSRAPPALMGLVPGLAKMDKLPIDLPLLICFALWYVGNYYYNISNKRALTAAGGAAGFPMTIATLQLGVGAVYAIFLWLAPDARKFPEMTFKDYVATLPVGFTSAGAHAASVFALSAGAVSFAQIVKASEPAFAAVIGTLAYGASLSLAKWLTLIPVIGGVCLASLGELDFAVSALVTAAIANVFAAIKGNENKKLMSTAGLKERIGTVGNQFAITTINSFLFLIPVMLGLEGKKFGEFITLAKTNPVVLNNMIGSGLWFYLYNELATLTISKTNAVTASVANTAKRVIVIVIVALVMGESLGALKLIGSGIGIGGVFLYSIIDKLVAKFKEKKAPEPATE